MRKVFQAYIGPTGLPSARVCENGQVSRFYADFLCDALPSDFQEVSFCQEHMSSVVEVIQGREASTEWVGNAYAIMVAGDSVRFSNELTGEQGGEMPTYEYLSALALWKRFLMNSSMTVEGNVASSIEEAISLVVS